ncbi:lytic transglycosylase [Endothiovibrio diazotrophicus]
MSTRPLAALLLSLLITAGCTSQTARLDLPYRPDQPAVAATPQDLSGEQDAGTNVADAARPDADDTRPAEAAAAPTDDLWERIRAGFQLPVGDDRRTAMELKWYARHPKFMERTTERAEPFLYHIVEEVERRGMPTELALLPVVESAFQPFAYSHGRAAGLWQFIPGTGKRFGLKQNWWYDGRRDVIESTRAALDYLEYLHNEFDGDWLLALAAYNSGEGNVEKALRKNRRKGLPTDFFSLDLPRETEGYVPKLLAIRSLVADPAAHGLALQPIANEPQITTIDTGTQIDLALAAEMADLSLEEIYRYNPGYNRWATDPAGPHRLTLPVESAEAFKEQLAAYPADQRVKWQRHKIRSGEALSTIARHYHTTTAVLRQVNRLRGNAIRAGEHLIIPTAVKSLDHYALSQEQRLKQTQNRKRKGTRQEYVVRNGDTLWDIARKYKVSHRSLAKWNGMAPRDPLKPDRTLVVWTKAPSKAGDVVVSGNGAALTGETRRKIRYTVRRGDSLSRIAGRFKVSVSDLKRWNAGLTHVKYLQPGQRLTVHVDVTRQAGNI